MSRNLPMGIDFIEFGIFSPDDLRKISVAQIITADTYDEDGLPINSGLMDSRLGTIEPSRRCKTCGNRVGECPGHFGHIELTRPVIHEGFSKLIQRILRATCRNCSRLMIPDEMRGTYEKDMKKYAKTFGFLSEVIGREVAKLASKKGECPYCGEKQLKIKLEKPTTFYEQTEEGISRLTPVDIRERFEKIPEKDCWLLGINPGYARPEWMILTVLPVAPVCVRPSITLESGVRSEDDLTHKLVDVIRINQRLRENIDAGAPQLIVEDLWELLQYHVTTYFNNEVSGIPPARHRSGRALRTLTQRLKGKEGRFRSNLSGKRVDFSARTVISPDPNIGINDVGVPEDLAKILTVPEMVTEWNIEEVKELVKNGPEIHPGANYLIRPDGKRFDLRIGASRDAVADTITPPAPGQPPFVVERHLEDGDIVLFNRQPSLHRMSIMAHQVKVMPNRTFRLNLCVCLAGETEVLTNLGVVSIKELVEDSQNYIPLSCDWNKDKQPYFSGVSKVHAINPKQLGLKSYEIRTINGRIIQATEEHPFYTEGGIKKTKALLPGCRLAVYPIEYPKIGGCPAILTREQISNALPDHSYQQYTFKELESNRLIDIPAGSKKQIGLASLMGHLFGDGSLLIGAEGGRIVFRAKEYEDVHAIWQIANDLELQPTLIQESQAHEGVIRPIGAKELHAAGSCYFFEIRRKPIAIALNAIGVPEGDKVDQEYKLPAWLLNGPKMAKRAFLRAYFGSEMSTPRLHNASAKVFNQLVFKIAKVEGKSPNSFVQDLQILMDAFGVKLAQIKATKGNMRVNGTHTIHYSCTLESNDQNMLNFFTKIGFEFARAKETLARQAAEYLKVKQQAKEKASQQLKEAKILRAQGLSYPAIANRIGVSSWSTVASWFYNRRDAAGLPTSFPTFSKWCKTTTKGLAYGFVWDVISSIKEIDLPVAYDITTTDANHNFVAAEFLTGNCPPYNADFDGDEMNLHVPQSEEARAEARTLMRVQEQILSPRYGGPIIGAIQDFISGSYLLTRKSTLLRRREVNQLLIAANRVGELPPPAIEYPVELWTGKQIFSMFIPEGLNLSFKAKVHPAGVRCPGKEDCKHDAWVVIRDGVLLAGVIDEKAIGAHQAETMFHRIVKDYGTDRARDFLDTFTRMLIELLNFSGISVGNDNVGLSKEAKNRIKEILTKHDDKVNQLIETYDRGEFEPAPGRSVKETLEMRIQEELAEGRDEAGDAASEYLGLDNQAVIMAKTGARGKMLNLAQMAACVGQQAVRGERIIRGLQDRTLPHFTKGDLGAKAHGFIEASYIEGLSPIEFFFHAMGGREGLVDTAVRTSTSGYLQRRLVNALQDIKVEYDGTVRDSDGRIIQLTFGDDGVDPAKSDHGKAVNVDIIIEKVLGKEGQ